VGQRAGGATHGVRGALVEAGGGALVEVGGGALVGVVGVWGTVGELVGAPDPLGAALHAASARAASAKASRDAHERRMGAGGRLRRRRRAVLTNPLQHAGSVAGRLVAAAGKAPPRAGRA
jgi:hypothetical protein